MDANEARKRSEIGAIKAIEQLIEEAADRGFRSLDLSDYDVYDSFNDTVIAHFKEQGYKIVNSYINW